MEGIGYSLRDPTAQERGRDEAAGGTGSALGGVWRIAQSSESRRFLRGDLKNSIRTRRHRLRSPRVKGAAAASASSEEGEFDGQRDCDLGKDTHADLVEGGNAALSARANRSVLSKGGGSTQAPGSGVEC